MAKKPAVKSVETVESAMRLIMSHVEAYNLSHTDKAGNPLQHEDGTPYGLAGGFLARIPGDGLTFTGKNGIAVDVTGEPVKDVLRLMFPKLPEATIDFSKAVLDQCPWLASTGRVSADGRHKFGVIYVKRDMSASNGAIKRESKLDAIKAAFA